MVYRSIRRKINNSTALGEFPVVGSLFLEVQKWASIRMQTHTNYSIFVCSRRLFKHWPIHQDLPSAQNHAGFAYIYIYIYIYTILLVFSEAAQGELKPLFRIKQSNRGKTA